LIVAFAVGALLPAVAQAFSKAIWGPVYRSGVNQFPLYHRLGVSIYEVALYWNLAAPTRPHDPTNPADPAYRWSPALDDALAQAKRFHIRVLIQIIDTPAWANGGHRDPRWAPKRPGDYAAFVTAAARRYPGVHLWMIWGEPTKRGNFKPLVPARPGAALDRPQRRAPHLYAELLDSAYGALKRASVHNLVIGGSTYTTGAIDSLQWIENLRLPNGRPPRMDMYAHNPFGNRPPSFSASPSPFGEVQFSDLPDLGRWIDKYLHTGLPIFLSEWTIPTHPDQQFNFWVDPQVAAQWIAKALRLARGWHRIYALGWINVYDDPPLSYGGLLTATGSPKPGFAAFANG
jgi:hypothetical protein